MPIARSRASLVFANSSRDDDMDPPIDTRNTRSQRQYRTVVGHRHRGHDREKAHDTDHDERRDVRLLAAVPADGAGRDDTGHDLRADGTPDGTDVDVHARG